MKSIVLILSTFCSFAFANPLYSEQWALENTGQILTKKTGEYSFSEIPGDSKTDINMADVNLLKQGKETIVAIIDTGVDLNHPDLQGRIWKDKNCKNDNEYLCMGKNFLSPTQAAFDDKGHGTHVAGIIAANDNNIGIKGVTTSNVKIMALKVLSKKTQDYVYNRKYMSDYFADAINFAVKKGADVINMSVGFPALVLTPKFKQAVKGALMNEVPIVVAAGNNNKNIPVFPCSLKGVICVGAIDQTGTIPEFSNYGHMIDILAPGNGIISTYPISDISNETVGPIESRILRKAGYEIKKGTSQAAPFISGIIASIKSLNKNISIPEIKSKLYNTAKPIKDDMKYGLNGLVDMKAALAYKPTALYYPVFKENSQIIVKNKELQFSYELNLENSLGSDEELVISLDFSKDIQLDKSIYKIKTNGRNQIKLDIAGQLVSKEVDSIIPLNIKIESESFTKNYKADLSFSMGINSVVSEEYDLKDVNPRFTFLNRGARNYSRLKYVSGYKNQLDDPEYFYPSTNRAKENLINLLAYENKQFVKKTLRLAKNEVMINVIKGDFNLDNVNDYLFLSYIGTKDKSEFTLRYLDQNLKSILDVEALYFNDDSRVFEIPSGSNLINFDRRKINFSWMPSVLNNKRILLPVIQQKGIVPREDNSDNFIDFIQPRLSQKLYQLVTEVVDDRTMLKPRILLSQKNKNTIIQKLMDHNVYVQPWESFRLETVYKQPSTTHERLSYLISIGESNIRKWFKIEYENHKLVSIKIIANDNAQDLEFLSMSNSYVYMDHDLNELKDNVLFFSLVNRYNGQLAFLSEDNGVLLQDITTGNYSDPLFGFITTTHLRGIQHSYFESRYWVHLFTGKNESLIYPVNRESSFPGKEFSETLEVALGKINGRNEIGVFVNSVLLYGNQLHAVFPSHNKLIRPLGFTLTIPENCSYMLPEKFSHHEVSSLALNCIEGKKAVLKYVPLR